MKRRALLTSWLLALFAPVIAKAEHLMRAVAPINISKYTVISKVFNSSGSVLIFNPGPFISDTRPKPALQPDGSILLNGVDQCLKVENAFDLEKPSTVYFLRKATEYETKELLQYENQ